MIILLISLILCCNTNILKLNRSKEGLYTVKSCFLPDQCVNLAVDTANSKLLVRENSVDTSVLAEFEKLSEEEVETQIGLQKTSFLECSAQFRVEGAVGGKVQFGLVKSTESELQGAFGIAAIEENSFIREFMREDKVFLDFGNKSIGVGEESKFEGEPTSCKFQETGLSTEWNCLLDSVISFDSNNDVKKLKFDLNAVFNSLVREIFIPQRYKLAENSILGYLKSNKIRNKCRIHYERHCFYYSCQKMDLDKLSPIYLVFNGIGYKLEGKDLFEEIKGELQFLVKGSFHSEMHIGTVFMEKFKAVADLKEKQIQFYSGEREKEGNIKKIVDRQKIFLSLFLTGLIFLGVGGGVVVFYLNSSKIQTDDKLIQ